MLAQQVVAERAGPSANASELAAAARRTYQELAIVAASLIGQVGVEDTRSLQTEGRDLEAVYCNFVYSPFKSVDGDIEGIFVIASDVTEHVPDVPRHGLAVHGDPTRLSQVVSNLLTNAAKYTPAGGQITIRAATPGADVVLRVKDTGISGPNSMSGVLWMSASPRCCHGTSGATFLSSTTTRTRPPCSPKR